MSYFNDQGRCNPVPGMRVFGNKPSYYYSIHQPEIDYLSVFNRSNKFNSVNNIEFNDFKSKASSLLEVIKSDLNYSSILNGVHIPFVYDSPIVDFDLGENLEEVLLQNLKESFSDKYPEYHFKAVLQGNSELKNHISIEENSNYQQFISAVNKGPVVGWYFPQALQEYDVNSQRLQFQALPELEHAKVCLSGGMDVCSALIGEPGILINEEHYAPILCLSAYVHKDPRLVLLLKSYGPHLEFWCMSQMLTKDITQLSEQWAGGLTIYLSV